MIAPFPSSAIPVFRQEPINGQKNRATSWNHALLEPPVDRLPVYPETMPQFLVTEASFGLDFPKFSNPILCVLWHIMGFYQVLKLESTRKTGREKRGAFEKNLAR